ncbi:putative phospholipid ABC transporter permease protein MlaE, partial [Haemophilus influenzae]
TLHLLF